ncbi:hypothetical protein D3C78_1381560 [compost metagenome]
MFDVDLADDLADLPEDFLATNGAQAKTHVHQAQHIEVVQAFDPVAVIVEFAGGINATDHRAHGAAGNTGNVVATAFNFFDDPNMGIAPGAT